MALKLLLTSLGKITKFQILLIDNFSYILQNQSITLLNIIPINKINKTGIAKPQNIKLKITHATVISSLKQKYENSSPNTNPTTQYKINHKRDTLWTYPLEEHYYKYHENDCKIIYDAINLITEELGDIGLTLSSTALTLFKNILGKEEYDKAFPSLID